MISRLYHAVVLVGLSAIGANAACAAQSAPLARAPVDSSATPAPPVTLDAGPAVMVMDAAFDAAAEADAGWHPTK